jgi:large subunit ribosomal protein L30
MATSNLRVTMTKSKNGRLKNHQLCLKGLGLSKIGQSSVVLDTPENRGMIRKVAYMVEVQEI